WILLVIRPRNFLDYVRMCRLYGMTMSDIRMQEAWAMAHWLSREDPPLYGIEDDENTSYDIIVWDDNAITRVDAGSDLPAGATRLYPQIPGSRVLGFLTSDGTNRVRLHDISVSAIPFSTYDLGERPPQSLAIRYSSPDRKNGSPQRITALPPREMTL